MAKQVLVSMFTYHGTFIPVPADILRQFCTSVYTFVAANRPAAAGAAHLFIVLTRQQIIEQTQ